MRGTLRILAIIFAFGTTLMLLYGVLHLSSATVLAWNAEFTRQHQTAPTPFFEPPFFGTSRANCVFDHQYPIYTGEYQYGDPISSTVVHYDGSIASSPVIIGTRSCYSGHNGIDYGTTFERVLAGASGEVVSADWASVQNHRFSYGLYVQIRHANGFYTVYGHLSSLAVTMGSNVSTSEVIGVSGNTGNSTGPHLHFEVRRGTQTDPNVVVDPYGWIGDDNPNPNAIRVDPWSAPGAPGPVSYQLWSQFPALTQTDVYTSGQPLPPPPPPNESTGVIVDDLDPQFQITTGSCEQESAGYGGHLYDSFALSRTTPTCAVRWSLPSGGGVSDVWLYRLRTAQ